MNPATILRQAIWRADDRWCDSTSLEPVRGALGATLAAVLRIPDALVVAHMGDCRVHLTQAGRIKRRTSEHAIPLSRNGRTGRAITRLFGARGNPEVEVWEFEPGDEVLLTAGVHDHLADDELTNLLVGAKRSSTAETLVAQAIQRGATDDVIAFHVRLDPRAA